MNKESLAIVWEALETYREECIPDNDEAWDDICTAMARIQESLGE